jgi:hypothetical protein
MMFKSFNYFMLKLIFFLFFLIYNNLIIYNILKMQYRPLEIYFIIILIIYLMYFYIIDGLILKKNKNSNYNKKKVDGNVYITNYNFEFDDDLDTDDESDTDDEIDDTNNESKPSAVLLNDRYNPFKKSYTDTQLFLSSLEKSKVGDDDINYNQILIDDAMKDNIDDINSKILKKNRLNQRLHKNNKTVDIRSSNKMISKIYKDELDKKEKESSPWWFLK